jgi:hypothetical protein
LGKKFGAIDQLEPIFGLFQFLATQLYLAVELTFAACALSIPIVEPGLVPERSICFPSSQQAVRFGSFSLKSIISIAYFVTRPTRSRSATD